MAQESSQKFIGRNRAPRVQIEYDVELYGAEKKVELPFVIGVLADLLGRRVHREEPIEDRKFLEFDASNFDARLKALQPTINIRVADHLAGTNKDLAIEMSFESLDDFSPAAVARKVEPLRRLLEARQQLANLLTYMDGKAGTEELLAKLLRDQTALRALAAPQDAGKEGT